MIAVLLLTGCTTNQTEVAEESGKTVDVPQNASEETQNDNFNATGMPIVTETITLKGFASQHAFQGPFDQMLVLQEMEKMTNIKIEWETVPQDGFVEKRNLKFASNDLPDFLFRGQLSDDDVVNYGNQGLIIDLSDLIDQYAPNLKKYLDEHPDWLSSIRSPEGKIYALPLINEADNNRVIHWFINKPWLDALQLAAPQTTEQYYEVLKAFRDNDPNGNGLQDEVPLSGTGGVIGFADMFMGAWGLGTTGMTFYKSTLTDLGPDGNIRFIPTDPRYREVLQYINMLWNEELIDKNVFTNNIPEIGQIGREGKLGAVNALSASDLLADPEKDRDFQFILPLKGPHGDQLHSNTVAPVAQKGAFAITKVNEHPEAILRWADHLYSAEGYELLFWGVEGKTFTKSDKGYKFVESISNNPNMTEVIARGQFTPLIGGNIPYIFTTEYWNNFPFEETTYAIQLNVDANKLYAPYYPAHVWSPFLYTKEESAELKQFTDLKQYISDKTTDFIIGKTPFSEWDNYVQQLENMNLQRYMEIINTAYERFKQVN